MLGFVAASIISESGNIGALYRYWLSLNNGAVPARDQIDPAAIKPLLPHIYLVAFETNPFRVHYRLSGTFADQWNGLTLAGRYLDEFLANDAYGGNRLVHDSYERVWRTGAPVFGSYQWPTRGGYLTETRFGLLPLTQAGLVTQAISAEDFDMAPIGDSFMPFEDPRRQK